MSGSVVRVGATLLLFGLIVGAAQGAAEAPVAGAVPRFAIEATDIGLSRPAQPFTPFDKVGRRFAILGFEGGNFEAWAYPLKLVREFGLSFLIGTSTVPIEGRDIVRFISVDPAVTTLTFTDQSFTVRAHFVASVEDPGAVILLEIDAVEPLTVVASFLPVLQPMWPAGLGGQYAYWDQDLKAYLISEPTRKNHGYVGSPAATGISYTPAHMLSDTPNQFKIEIPDPKSVSGVFIPVVLAGGEGKREDVRALYQKLAADPGACYREAVRHYDSLRGQTLRVRTPEPQIDRALEWAKVALDNLIVDNPDLGKGVVAGLGPSGTGGRPGFGWFFGTDAYLNSLSFNSLNDYAASRDALTFTRKWQRKDGKMAHELSQAAGYLKWWEDYPYGYIHGDTTPYYIVAAADYFRATGDMGFLKESWPSLERAYDWCLTTDADGDGLMDNAKAGLGALEFGALTGIRTDIYLAAVWSRANMAMREMAEAVGDKTRAADAEKNGARAARAFDEKFWDAERGQYSFAFDKDGRLVQELTPWSAVGIAWGLGRRERGLDTLARMNSSDLATDWGVRMLSVRSPFFEPLNYNYGAVWPFLSGWVSTALLRCGFVPQGYEVLMANVRHTFDNALGSVTELFSGFANVWPREGVPHQGFSTTGIVLPLVRGLLGLEGNAARSEIAFEPRFPADWRDASISGWKVGKAVFALDFERADAKVTLRVRSENAAGFKLRFSPAFGPGTAVRTAALDGRPLRFDLEGPASSPSVRPVMEVLLTGDDRIELVLDPAPEIVPPRTKTMTGDLNHGLRIIRTERAGREMRISVEGLAGESYRLALRNGDLIDSVSGADLEGGALRLSFPAGKPGEFVGRTVVLRLRS
jgi:glycogen debranching enzyme